MLELGPGPGRFTPLVRARPRTAVLAVDLSRNSLRAARRRTATRGPTVHWIQAMGEQLPLAPQSVDHAVALGNIVCFAYREGDRLVAELSRVVRPGGLLIADFASAAAAVQEFVYVASQRRILPRLLRRPRYYLIDRVLRTGDQPWAPHRYARWAFRFYTVDEAVRLLDHHGFDVVDTLAMAPTAAHQPRAATIAAREPATWRALLRIEEEVGRRPGVFETGNGFAIAARRRGDRRGSRRGLAPTGRRPDRNVT